MKQFLESADLLQTIASKTEKAGGEARHLVADLTGRAAQLETRARQL